MAGEKVLGVVLRKERCRSRIEKGGFLCVEEVCRCLWMSKRRPAQGDIVDCCERRNCVGGGARLAQLVFEETTSSSQRRGDVMGVLRTVSSSSEACVVKGEKSWL